MPLEIAIILILAVICLAFYGAFSVGVMIGTSAAEARVVDYVNDHPNRQMLTMADTLYGDKKFLHPGPWGSFEVPEANDEPTVPVRGCTFPTCECPGHIVPTCHDQQLFI